MAKPKKKPTQNVENIGGQVIQAGGNVTINEKSSKTTQRQKLQSVGLSMLTSKQKWNHSVKQSGGVIS